MSKRQPKLDDFASDDPLPELPELEAPTKPYFRPPTSIKLRAGAPLASDVVIANR